MRTRYEFWIVLSLVVGVGCRGDDSPTPGSDAGRMDGDGDGDGDGDTDDGTPGSDASTPTIEYPTQPVVGCLGSDCPNGQCAGRCAAGQYPDMFDATFDFCAADPAANYCLTVAEDLASQRTRFVVTCEGGELKELISCGSAPGCSLSEDGIYVCMQ